VESPYSKWVGVPLETRIKAIMPRIPNDLSEQSVGKRSQRPIQRPIVRKPQPSALPKSTKVLSVREQQVFHYWKQGIAFREISIRLGCSPSAVQEYFNRALKKLECSSGAEWAMTKAQAHPHPHPHP
jgi:DNA-binding NarL/FixJ family response regulator